MRDVMEAIRERTTLYEGHPLFEFLRDSSIEPSRRLAFAPSAVHYSLSFKDFCQLVLREEPARDRIQEIVNALTYEEAVHSRWLLADLKKLGHDPVLSFTDALEFIWGDATAKTRMLTYQLCSLGLGADSVAKFVLVHCVEATAEVTIKHVRMVGKEWSARSGQSLDYFGETHEDAEAHHNIWERESRAVVADLRLKDGARRDLLALVERAFRAFTGLADNLLETARAERRVQGA